MNRSLVTLVFILFLTGCGTVVSDNQNQSQKNIASKTDAVSNAKGKIAKNVEEKLSQVSGLSYGLGYSLDRISSTNKINEIETAKVLNNRIISLAGSPDLDEMNKIKLITDLLNSEVKKEHDKGIKLLAEKDQEIVAVQKEKDDLNTNLERKLEDLTSAAKKQAEESDSNKVIIDSVNKWFGLGAVFYGLKRFITSCLVGILIFGVIFLVLRILATVNPIAAGIFSIFNIIGATVIQLVRGLVPKSLPFSGFSPTNEMQKYKTTLLKLVDNIEEVQVNHAADTTISLKDLLEHFDKELDQSDKDLITHLKTELRWKK